MGANIINYNSVIENTSSKSAESACQCSNIKENKMWRSGGRGGGGCEGLFFVETEQCTELVRFPAF